MTFELLKNRIDGITSSFNEEFIKSEGLDVENDELDELRTLFAYTYGDYLAVLRENNRNRDFTKLTKEDVLDIMGGFNYVEHNIHEIGYNINNDISDFYKLKNDTFEKCLKSKAIEELNIIVETYYSVTEPDWGRDGRCYVRFADDLEKFKDDNTAKWQKWYADKTPTYNNSFTIINDFNIIGEDVAKKVDRLIFDASNKTDKLYSAQYFWNDDEQYQEIDLAPVNYKELKANHEHLAFFYNFGCDTLGIPEKIANKICANQEFTELDKTVKIQEVFNPDFDWEYGTNCFYEIDHSQMLHEIVNLKKENKDIPKLAIPYFEDKRFFDKLDKEDRLLYLDTRYGLTKGPDKYVDLTNVRKLLNSDVDKDLAYLYCEACKNFKDKSYESEWEFGKTLDKVYKILYPQVNGVEVEDRRDFIECSLRPFEDIIDRAQSNIKDWHVQGCCNNLSQLLQQGDIRYHVGTKEHADSFIKIDTENYYNALHDILNQEGPISDYVRSQDILHPDGHIHDFNQVISVATKLEDLATSCDDDETRKNLFVIEEGLLGMSVDRSSEYLDFIKGFKENQLDAVDLLAHPKTNIGKETLDYMSQIGTEDGVRGRARFYLKELKEQEEQRTK